MSSSRRSGETMLRVALTNPSFGAPTILVREQFGDGRDLGLGPIGDNHPRFRVVIADQFAADAAGRDHLDALVLLMRLGMADGDDGLDAMVAAFGDRAPDRDGLGADGDAPDIGVDIDAGDDAAVARAKRRADLLPFVAVTAS